MATVIISISLKPGSNQLHLEDSEGHSGNAPSFFTNVNHGDVIIWELEKNSGIQEIKNIRAKDGYFNLLKDGGPKKRGNGDWMGLVKDDAAGEDNYDIDYEINGKQHTEDPKIQIGPGN